MEIKQSLSEKAVNVVLAVGISIVAISICISLFTNLFSFYDLKLSTKNVPLKTILTGLTIAPLGEELIFRLVPISLLKDTKIFEDKKWYIIAIISAIFGYIHGGYYNIWIQGIAGFGFGWVYIKNGMSYWSAVSAHFLYNLMIYVIFPIII